MALISSTTNLKTLKYEEFGGSVTRTKEPLVTKDITKNPSPSNSISLGVDRRVDDVKRIGKLLTSTPAALKFSANQAALNTLEQRIKSNKKGSVAGDIIRGAGNTAKVLASTIAQIPVSGTGTHFVKGFAGKLGYIAGIQGHRDYKNNYTLSQDVDGKGIIVTDAIQTKGKLDIPEGAPNTSKSIILQDFLYSDPNFRKKTRTKLFKESIQPVSKQNTDDAGNITPDDKTKRSNFPVLSEKGSFSLEDNEYFYTNNGNKVTTSSPELDQIGGFVEANKKDESGEASKAYDQITARAPVVKMLSEFVEDNPADDATVEVFKDTIKFRIKIIEPTSGPDPKITMLQFRAFLDSFNDNYAASWGSSNYIGRAEPFYNYGGFNRDISFSFKVAAFSKGELDTIYNKLNLLSGHLAPTYTGNSYMRGNFAAVTIGNYLQNQTGVFNSIDFSWNTDYQFDVDKELPTILDVQCSFTPIHAFNTTFGSEYIGRATNLQNIESTTGE